jgi:quinoprotein glucose dehydrogenase
MVKSSLKSLDKVRDMSIIPAEASDTRAFMHSNVLTTRSELDYEVRLSPPDDPKKAATMHHYSGIVGRGIFMDPEQKRSFALALGHFNQLRRKTDGDTTDSTKFLIDRQSKYQVHVAVLNSKRENIEEFTKALGEFQEREAAATSADLLADRLIVMAVDNAEGDPFLRDAFTRGLERLGPAGLEAVVQAIGSNDRARSEAALYALQGWRSVDGLNALIAEATTPNEISSSARIGLFRALRELGEAVPPEPIAEWLAGNPKAASGPRAAAIRVLTAMGARAGASVQPIVVGLLNDDEEDVRIAAIPLAGMARSDATREALVRLATPPGLVGEQRRLAFAALRGYSDPNLAPVFAEALKSPGEPAVRGEILRGLAAIEFNQGVEAAKTLLADPSRELRAEAIAVLGQKPGSALIVVTLYNEGKLPREDLSRVIEAARPHRSPELSAAVNELMKMRMLGSSGLEDVRKFQDLVKKHGNSGRGKAVYLDASKANCASCHRMEGSGGSVGPDLTRVWETLSFEKKVESILDPSKEIKEGYVTYKVATKDGRVANGLLLSDTAEAVTLKDAQGREIRIPSAEVDQKATDKISLMPEGVVAHLSLEEFVDLLAFLGDRQAQEGLRGLK